VPRCAGGTDEASNLVYLTPEEHYVAHQLLVKLHPKHAGLALGLFMMTMCGDRMARNNRCYGWVRRRARVSARSGYTQSEETKQKMRAARLANPTGFVDPKRRGISDATKAKLKALALAREAEKRAAKYPHGPLHHERAAAACGDQS